jgi:hypothetical protein
MLSGFWTTSPESWPLASASVNAWLESNPMKAILPARSMS